MTCRAATHFPRTAGKAQIPGQQGPSETADVFWEWWATCGSVPKGYFGMGQGHEWSWGMLCLHGELQERVPCPTAMCQVTVSAVGQSQPWSCPDPVLGQ